MSNKFTGYIDTDCHWSIQTCAWSCGYICVWSKQRKGEIKLHKLSDLEQTG